MIDRDDLITDLADAMQDVHDMDTGFRDFARAAVRYLDRQSILPDADRWRALVRLNIAQEIDLSSGPGTPKTVILSIDVAGCERYDPKGAPDFKATLEAALDDEVTRFLGEPR